MDKSQVRSCISGSGSITYDPLTGIIGGGGGGGGDSISYYLNGSINQGTFSGNTYYEMNKVPVIGAGTNFTIATNGYISQFITDANDPSQLNIPAGNWIFEMYFQASSGGGSPTFYVELYKWDGAAFTLIASSSTNPEGITNGTAVDLYTTALAVPATTLAITDRLAVRVYVNNSGRTITLHTEDNNLCQVITTFTTGLTELNGLTAQVQTFATGTTGTDFGIVSSGSTHTFNLPTASALNRGALSAADWATFNNKGTVTSVDLTMPSAFSVAGNPITTSGTLAVTGAGTTSQYVRGDGSLATLPVQVVYTRLNDNDTVNFYDYCGQAPLGTAQSSAVWLIRRIEWATTTPITKSAIGAWTNRASLIYT